MNVRPAVYFAYYFPLWPSSHSGIAEMVGLFVIEDGLNARLIS